MNPIVAVMKKEIRDSVRSRWMTVFAMTFGLLAIALSLVQSSSDSISVQGFNRTTAALINLCLLLVPLISILVGAGSISGERERGTWPVLLSMPISINQLIIGKFIGLAVAVSATIAVGFGGAGIIVALVSPVSGIFHYLVFTALSIVLAGATLSVGIVISIFSDGRLKALSRALILWFVMAVIYDLAAIGIALAISATGRYLFIAVLTNPVECIRILLILTLDPEGDVLGPLGSYVVNEVGRSTSVCLITAALVLWIIVPIIMTISTARNQDA